MYIWNILQCTEFHNIYVTRVWTFSLTFFDISMISRCQFVYPMTSLTSSIFLEVRNKKKEYITFYMDLCADTRIIRKLEAVLIIHGILLNPSELLFFFTLFFGSHQKLNCRNFCPRHRCKYTYMEKSCIVVYSKQNTITIL